MIVGNTSWESNLAARQKKPLYYLFIDYYGLFVLSFNSADENVPLTDGYGTAYGTGYGYGDD